VTIRELNIIKKTLSISILILFVLSLTAVAVSAVDADVKQDGPGSVKVHISGISGADTCSMWLDRDPANDPANNPNPTGGGPPGADGTLNFNKLGADVNQPHHVWIKCYHANKKTSFWDAERDFTPSAAAASPAPAAPEAPAAPAAASLNGVYFLQATNGEQAGWTVTSCGSGCLHIHSTGGWSENASLVNKDQYSVTVFDPNGATCPDGTKVAMTKTYVFGAGMTGGTRTVVRWDGCVGHGGGNELPPAITFTMSKTG
jgi:hypothetical protein